MLLVNKTLGPVWFVRFSDYGSSSFYLPAQQESQHHYQKELVLVPLLQEKRKLFRLTHFLPSTFSLTHAWKGKKRERPRDKVASAGLTVFGSSWIQSCTERSWKTDRTRPSWADWREPQRLSGTSGSGDTLASTSRSWTGLRCALVWLNLSQSPRAGVHTHLFVKAKSPEKMQTWVSSDARSPATTGNARCDPGEERLWSFTVNISCILFLNSEEHGWGAESNPPVPR